MLGVLPRALLVQRGKGAQSSLRVMAAQNGPRLLHLLLASHGKAGVRREHDANCLTTFGACSK